MQSVDGMVSRHLIWRYWVEVNDADGDGFCATEDNCAVIANPDQADADGDGIGDACDNCLAISNSGQTDTDGDTQGNTCDDDDDNDGLLDANEANTGIYVSPSNTRTDPLVADTDGDGFDDGLEVAFGSDPVVATSFPIADGDLAPFGAPDGNINAADLMIAIRIALDQIPAGPLELAHGDMNSDGIIDLSDVLVITQLVLNQEPVGLRIILLRRWESGPKRPVFSLRRVHYAPRSRDNLFSLFHQPRYEPLSPTGSRRTCTQLRTYSTMSNGPRRSRC